MDERSKGRSTGRTAQETYHLHKLMTLFQRSPLTPFIHEAGFIFVE